MIVLFLFALLIHADAINGKKFLAINVFIDIMFKLKINLSYIYI
jgi:hypothetical protein